MTDVPVRVALVGSSKSKLSDTAPAQDLYTSTLFKKSRAWAEHYCDEWYILSSEHGLLLPTDRVKPYDHSINDLLLSRRQLWAAHVYSQMVDRGILHPQRTYMCEFHWLAGLLYAEFLISKLCLYEHVYPLAGLGSRSADALAHGAAAMQEMTRDEARRVLRVATRRALRRQRDKAHWQRRFKREIADSWLRARSNWNGVAS